MTKTTLDHVQHMVDDLSLVDQARLLEYLARCVASAVAANDIPSAVPFATSTDAWAEFFRIGDTIAADDTGTAASLTAAVLLMRRSSADRC